MIVLMERYIDEPLKMHNTQPLKNSTRFNYLQEPRRHGKCKEILKEKLNDHWILLTAPWS